ncbi:MAG TPA: acyl-CoA dehydrogenase family protein [Stellaceae bacterium]|jgi:alkylation response protein AidB-like acyl-CoA dehydrogenase|nr:acyl-CoA dehydrogenase family protein [Stellaceae bacterium]
MNDISPIAPVARARDIADLITNAADTIERSRRFPAPLLDALHDARLFRMLLPRSVGGDQVTPGAYIEAVAEAASADGSVGWCLSIANSTGLISAYMDTEIAREIWGNPRNTVAWGPPNDARAAAVPGGYRISGRWDFASGSRHAAWMGAHGLVVESDGSLRLNSEGRPTLKSWLFPASSATLLDNWNPIGLRGTASESYEVSDLFVSEAYTSTREDPAARRERGPLYAFPQQTMYSVGIASVALGIARGMLDAFMDLAGAKTPRGMSRLADNAVIQAEIARCEARLGAARAYLLDTVGRIYAQADDIAPIDVPARARVRLAAAHAITNAVAVADYTYKAAGVDAIFPGSPLERRFRDIHTVSQQIQSRDVHYETCGQVLLGSPPTVFL